MTRNTHVVNESTLRESVSSKNFSGDRVVIPSEGSSVTNTTGQCRLVHTPSIENRTDQENFGKTNPSH